MNRPNRGIRVPQGALLVLIACFAPVGCASTAGALPDVPGATSVPGFDIRHHPGAEALEVWRAESPYRWIGFYLPAPCYTGVTWQGRSEQLRDSGWGLAVLFVGEQDWRHSGTAAMADPADREREDAAELRCTAGNLSATRGVRDGGVAVDAAREEGFADGTWIYLDVEPVSSVSTELAAYVRAWTGAVLDDGTYRPALYLHDRNVRALLPVVSEAWVRRGLVPTPRLWVTGGSGFRLDARPGESGHPAHVWQGPLDRTEEWGGVTLVVDPNVAGSADPSG